MFERYPVALVLGLALATPALAQDLEYRDPDIEADEESPFTISGRFETEWHEYQNLDFRPLDETSDQSILDSDDRGGFPYSGAALDIGYQVDPAVRILTSFSHRGLWGADQTGNNSRFGGFLYFNAFAVEMTTKPTADESVVVTVGREYYQLGNLGGGRDYILADVLDQIRVAVPIGVGTLDIIPVNVIQQTDNDGLDFVSYIGSNNIPTYNFNGDTMMRRHMLVARLDELPGPVDGLLYGAYTDIGAGVSAPSLGLYSTGVDISYQGLLGNFTDNDWVANFGLRASGEFGAVRPFAHVDVSTGIDRKELVAVDVNTNGVAYGGGFIVETGDDDAGLNAMVQYFDALGPGYQADGLQFSHGYVGLKAQQVGGQLFNRFLGFHPSAYVSLNGIADTPQEPSRRSGTRSVHVGADYELPGPMGIEAGWWVLQDTGFTALNLNRLDQIDPPFGYARDEFAAEERMGKLIGQEVNLDITAQLTDSLSAEIGGAIILPGAYYSIEIARVAGDALGFSDPAMPMGAHAGLRVNF